jgi:hypothetical protein
MSKSRKYNQATKLISTWEELAECKSETHTLEINTKGGYGWINPIKEATEQWAGHHYLSTHIFYGKHHQESTRMLQSCGFNVKIANWDAEEDTNHDN